MFRFKLNTTNAGFLQAWMDGERIVDHRGNLGFNTPAHRDYVKFGYYNWSPADELAAQGAAALADHRGRSDR